MKNKKDNIQKHQILITTKQNADLINHLNDIKKQQTNLEKENIKLKSQCSALGKTLENYKRGANKQRDQSPDEEDMERNIYTAIDFRKNIPDIVRKQESATVNDFFKINTLNNFDKNKNLKSKKKYF